MDSLTLVLFMALRFVVVIPAIVVHEVAHGYSAYLMGDPTAKQAGRLTLNPLKHIDTWGTILLPLVLLVVSGGAFSFGYAKPVPFNPIYFRDRRNGTLITGIAGPLANLALAVASAVVLMGLRLLGLDGNVVGAMVMFAIEYSILINLILLAFNLLPIPGLDGSHVVQRFLPPHARARYVRASRYMFPILFAVIFLPSYLGIPSVIGTYLGWTAYPVYELLTLGGTSF